MSITGPRPSAARCADQRLTSLSKRRVAGIGIVRQREAEEPGQAGRSIPFRVRLVRRVDLEKQTRLSGYLNDIVAILVLRETDIRVHRSRRRKGAPALHAVRDCFLQLPGPGEGVAGWPEI